MSSTITGATSTLNIAAISGDAVSGINGGAVSYGRSINTETASFVLSAISAGNLYQDFTGTLTALIVITLPLSSGVLFIVRNETVGGFGITLQAASGTGVTVGAAKSAIIMCDGTNWIRITPDT